MSNGDYRGDTSTPPPGYWADDDEPDAWTEGPRIDWDTPATSLDELQARFRWLLLHMPGNVHIALVQPCKRCGHNLWDSSTHNDDWTCRYPPAPPLYP